MRKINRITSTTFPRCYPILLTSRTWRHEWQSPYRRCTKRTPNEISNIFAQCLWRTGEKLLAKKHPKERPTFSQLAEKIEKYIKLWKNSDYLDTNGPCENVLAKEIDVPTNYLEIVKMLSNKSLSEQTDVVSWDTWNRWIVNGNQMNYNLHTKIRYPNKINQFVKLIKILKIMWWFHNLSGRIFLSL